MRWRGRREIDRTVNREQAVHEANPRSDQSRAEAGPSVQQNRGGDRVL